MWPLSAQTHAVRVPAGELVWQGLHHLGGTDYRARLYRIQSREGARKNGIDRTLALTVHPARPEGSLLMLIGGGRDLQAHRSFGAEIDLGGLDLRRILDRGYTIAFLEYRGSKTPGSKRTFTPPLPRYGDLVAGYDRAEACEYGFGDAYDVVAAARFLMSGKAFPVRRERIYVGGGSHGGYLALRLAREVKGLAGVVAGHPPTDLAGSLAYFANAPTARHPLFGRQTPAGPARVAALAFGALSRRMGGLEDRPETGLLLDPPSSDRILIFHNVDDWLVTVQNSRWYVERWQRTHPGILYVEFDSRDLPRWFRHDAEQVAERGLLGTHQEDLSGSALEPLILRVLGLENGPVEIPRALRGPHHTDLRLALRSRDPGIDLAGARVTWHDWPATAPLPPVRATADRRGAVTLRGVWTGYGLVDVETANGARGWRNLSVYADPRAETPAELVLR